MLVYSFLFRLVRFLLPLCALATAWLYFFPLFHRCDFPKPSDVGNTERIHTTRTHAADDVAPFRLLALGDPQLEGDSSLPNPDDPFFPSLKRLSSLDKNTTPSSLLRVIKETAREFGKDDIPRFLTSLRKRIDLIGNDYYLAHIYRTLHWWTEPTHVAVLGDLLGSQWVSDEEFERRAWRYWKRVFKDAKMVDEDVMKTHDEANDPTAAVVQRLGEDESWSQRIINIVGNHDIGYAGDLDGSRVARFERAFGRVNWDMRFTLPKPNATSEPPAEDEGLQPPSIHLVVLNSMNLDGPVRDSQLQTSTYTFINSVISHRSHPVEDRSSFTLVLTHIPLYKESGLCVDGPFFTYFPDYLGGGLKEQNQLSESASMGILEGLLGMSGREDAPMRGLGRNGLIVNGHDHEGCDTWHHITTGQDSWQASRYIPSLPCSNTTEKESTNPSIREVTLRAMMGEYGGNAGLISLWFDWDAGQWQYSVNKCAAGVQHWWWAVHIVDAVMMGILLLATAMKMLTWQPAHPSSKEKHNKDRLEVQGNGTKAG